jgi:hypothetical protein
MELLEIKKMPKNAEFYCCVCDYRCYKKSNWIIHTKTKKHYYGVVGNDLETLETKKMPKNAKASTIFKCECSKLFSTKSGLWKHKKACKNRILEKQGCQITPELIIDLMKQNKELQNVIIEQNKTIQVLTEKTGTNNSYNKTFNLQLFLNETCKDAINLTDFVNQIQVSINDLEETGRLGYAEGISKVVINNLKDIDSTKRPIHCSDIKRETLYIKDDNKWEKDDNKSILTKAIKSIANKNIKKISEWQKLYPDYSDPDSKQNDKYMQIVVNSMSGSTKEESDKNYDKIVKNVIKETIIDKD